MADEKEDTKDGLGKEDEDADSKKKAAARPKAPMREGDPPQESGDIAQSQAQQLLAALSQLHQIPNIMALLGQFPSTGVGWRDCSRKRQALPM